MSSTADPLESELAAGIDALGLGVPSGRVASLISYLRELERWNRRYNLTAVRDPRDMVARHLLDSLSIAPWVMGARVLDVGSGAGLPGIPLALWAPRRHFDLLDANGKKARFLRHAVRTLELSNVGVIEQRVADYRPRDCYDTVVARAFAGLAELTGAVAHLTRTGGRLLAMRGRAAEPVPDAPRWRHVATFPLAVPGLDARRHLTVLAREPDE